MVVLIFQPLIATNFRKIQNFVQVNVVESIIYICKIFQCLGITTISRSFVPPVGPIRTLPSFDQQGSYSNDYSGGSVSNRASSSYGGASNDLIQPPATGGAYGGAGDLSAGSNR